MHKKLLKLDRVREKKTYFLFFLNEEFLDFFFFKFREKSGIFNIEFISYSVRLQPNIK